MVKRTIYFGNPAYLRLQNEQMIVENYLPAAGKAETGDDVSVVRKSIPIEDIGVVVLDHQQITITQALLAKLLSNNTAVITCDGTHHPSGLLMPLDGSSLQSLKFRYQVEASQPLKKQLWQQTVIAKVCNQAGMLRFRRE